MTQHTLPDGVAEVRALGRLAFEEVGGAIAGIGQIHKAIATRAFAAAGPGAVAARAAHDAVARRVYGTLRAGSVAAGRRAGDAVASLLPADRPPLSAAPRAGLTLAVLNGLIGDQLERDGSALQAPMALRVGGNAVAPDAPSLAEAFPHAGPRLAVFVHGLMETELSWRYGGRETYGARLERDHGLTPVYLRYNTGRHISENGRSLAELLADLVSAWPVEVQSIALVGHSMGGLVARSACHVAATQGADWVRVVRHVVTLGTPHLGAPLAQSVHVLSAGLNLLPESRAFGAVLRRRSAGIRDLRRGSLVDEDWRDSDPEALRTAACREVPLLEGATHCFVAACVTRDHRSPLGRIVGDTLVLVPSASGRGRTRRIPFRDEDGLRLGGVHHLALLNHPQVYEQLARWVAPAPAHVGE